MKKSFEVWLSSWRNLYVEPGKDNVPLLDDEALPKAFDGVIPKVVLSEGGAAGGVVSEGMGYGLMLEGMAAVRGDGWALDLGLSLMRSWMGMVQGPDPEQVLGGANGGDDSATKLDSASYGVSAVKGKGPAGVATWKYPPDLCAADEPWKPCRGSAADGDVDAVLGMVYLAGAKDYAEDFVDVVMRSVIAFASADLGFPDMYRVLPDGKRVYVPKAGSQWGGLTPPGGRFKAKGPEWCYNPSYFAPAHYRTFRDFVKTHWRKSFDAYLPPRLNGSKTSADDLMDAFDGAILGGYNILYYSSCESGAVSNWVGVETPCEDDDTLSCNGIPWAHTPYVGKDGGECSTSGTIWGSFGAESSRTFWRVAMDYALYAEESEKVDIYWRTGWVNQNVTFNARTFLNRIMTQYKDYAKCDGGSVGGCDCDWGDCVNTNKTRPWMLNEAFAVDKEPPTPGMICDNVPKLGQHQAWWAGFMSYPTFTAFIAPYQDYVYMPNKKLTAGPMSEQENRNWMNTFAFVCDFGNWTEKGGWRIEGKVCQRTYFHVSQEAIAMMIMSGSLSPLPAPKPRPKPSAEPKHKLLTQVKKFSVGEPVENIGNASYFQALVAAALLALATLGVAGVVARRGNHVIARQRTSECEAGPLIEDELETASFI